MDYPFSTLIMLIRILAVIFAAFLILFIGWAGPSPNLMSVVSVTIQSIALLIFAFLPRRLYESLSVRRNMLILACIAVASDIPLLIKDLNTVRLIIYCVFIVMFLEAKLWNTKSINV